MENSIERERERGKKKQEQRMRGAFVYIFNKQELKLYAIMFSTQMKTLTSFTPITFKSGLAANTRTTA